MAQFSKQHRGRNAAGLDRYGHLHQVLPVIRDLFPVNDFGKQPVDVLVTYGFVWPIKS
jgi:hypothetical protein